MSKLKWTAVSLLSLILLLGGLYGIHFLVNQPKTSQETELAEKEKNAALSLEGQPLPNFSISSPSGKIITNDTLSEKPMLIMEWASWCSFCQKQLPIIQDSYNIYGDEINFVLINTTGSNGETLESAQTYFSDKNYTMPWYLDNGMVTAKKLLVESIPTIYLVDKNQTIKKVFTTVQTKENISKALETILP